MNQDQTVRLVVFDCDGTLVDSQHSIVEAMTQAFDSHGLSRPDAESIRRVVGLALPEAVARLMPEEAMGRLDSISTAYKDAFVDIRQRPGHEEPLYPAPARRLTRCCRTGRCLVSQPASRAVAACRAERHDLGDRFSTLKTADDGPGKPNPDILLDAMAEVGATPECTVMIGDTTFDIEMAVRAHALSIGVAWGYHATEELQAVGAQRIARRYGGIAVNDRRLMGEPNMKLGTILKIVGVVIVAVVVAGVAIVMSMDFNQYKT